MRQPPTAALEFRGEDKDMDDADEEFRRSGIQDKALYAEFKAPSTAVLR